MRFLSEIGFSYADVPTITISGVLTLIGVVLAALFIRKKTRAETANLYTEATERLIKIYEERDKYLEVKIKKSENNERSCRKRLGELETSVKELQDELNMLTIKIEENK